MTDAPSASKESQPNTILTGIPQERPVHWIVVTDDRSAHIYRKTQKGLERLPEDCIACSQPLPGVETEIEAFPRDLASWLNAAAREGAFDRIALLAPVEMLDTLHPFLEQGVREKICAVRHKDAVAISEGEIEDRIADVAWL